MSWKDKEKSHQHSYPGPEPHGDNDPPSKCGHQCIRGMPLLLSDQTWGLFHRKEFLPGTVNPGQEEHRPQGYLLLTLLNIHSIKLPPKSLCANLQISVVLSLHQRSFSGETEVYQRLSPSLQKVNLPDKTPQASLGTSKELPRMPSSGVVGWGRLYPSFQPFKQERPSVFTNHPNKNS